MRARQTEGLAELVVLVETGLTGGDDRAATGDHVTDGVAADGDGTDAKAANLEEAAAAQNEGGGALGVGIVFREHLLLTSRLGS